MIHHWVSKFGLPQYLITDRRIEWLNPEMAKCCTLFNICHSPRTLPALWTNGLVLGQIKNLGTHLRMLAHDAPENWSIQVRFLLMLTMLNH